MKCKYFTIVSLLSLSIIAPSVNAAPEWVSGKLSQLLNHETFFGHCMVYSASFTPSNGCPAGWVSLDCAGNHLEKSVAGRMWDSVQLAYALDKSVDIYLDDSRRNNGHCIASRLDVY